jgi:3-deoxy-D-manno-octulosonic-acid transferase
MSLASSCYLGATRAFEPAIRFLYRALGVGEDQTLRRERLGGEGLSPVDSWWHAASLGEVAALEPVLALAETRALSGRFLVTTTSAAGREAARKRWPNAMLAPLDLPRTLAAALTARRPCALILVETELWPNLLRASLDRGTRVAVVNGRVSDRSWARLRWGSPVPRSTLAGLSAVAARTEEDAARFTAMGVPEAAVRVCGNTKHDREGGREPAHLPWSDCRLWTAGSVRPGEEAPVLDAFLALRSGHRDLRLAIAPRHLDTEGEWLAALDRRGLRAARRSRPEGNDAEASVLLVDTRGELESFYAASAVVFVGGTLVPVGGHNVMEPAAAGAPVLVGPHHANVAGDVTELKAAGGLRVVEDTDQLAAAVHDWLESVGAHDLAAQGARSVAQRSRGAAGRSLDWLVERRVLPVS